MNQPISPELLAARAQQKMLKKKRKKTPVKTIKKTAISPTQRKGYVYEQRAATYLRQQGLEILMQNLDDRFGEIDIVARSQNCLVFVEVRQRRSGSHGGAIYSVQTRKQQRIIRTAERFLPSLCHQFFDGITPFCRFDVIAIEGENLTWLKNAFM